jgi:hypothetical protein
MIQAVEVRRAAQTKKRTQRRLRLVTRKPDRQLADLVFWTVSSVVPASKKML